MEEGLSLLCGTQAAYLEQKGAAYDLGTPSLGLWRARDRYTTLAATLLRKQACVAVTC